MERTIIREYEQQKIKIISVYHKTNNMPVSPLGGQRWLGTQATEFHGRHHGAIFFHSRLRDHHRYPKVTVKRHRISVYCMQQHQHQQQSYEQVLVVIGGGAAGIFGAIRAKNVMPQLKVLVVEKGKPLTKVRISGGGRCNVTNGHSIDTMLLADHYPRGNRELRGSYFKAHGPKDTVTWFSCHGVQLKTEEDGRMFPVSDSSSTIVDCLLSEAHKNGVLLESGRIATRISCNDNGRFDIMVAKAPDNLKQTIQADYLLIATGGSRQGYVLAVQLGHTIVEPRPSLFTFKIKDSDLNKLAGVSFSRVRAKLKLPNLQKSIPQLTQVGPMLVTHWGFSGPVILRLSAWAARLLFSSAYKGTLLVDFVPDLHVDDVKNILLNHKRKYKKQKLQNSSPPEFHLPKRFWQYLVEHQGLDKNTLWASVSHHSLQLLASSIKNFSFDLSGKGEFKDEFVTAGGVPLSEINLNTMESRTCPNLFFAGEVINVDGITGGFNFQNAWTGGYIAGTSIAKSALSHC